MMKRKLRNWFWMIVIVVLSFPIGYASIVVYDSMLVYSEVVLNFMVGGISIILLFGMLSFIVYRILKKRHKVKDPAKIALLIYSIILVLILLIVSPQFELAVIKHQLKQAEFELQDIG